MFKKYQCKAIFWIHPSIYELVKQAFEDEILTNEDLNSKCNIGFDQKLKRNNNNLFSRFQLRGNSCSSVIEKLVRNNFSVNNISYNFMKNEFKIVQNDNFTFLKTCLQSKEFLRQKWLNNRLLSIEVIDPRLNNFDENEISNADFINIDNNSIKGYFRRSR